MKKTALAFTILAVSMIVFVSLSFNTRAVGADSDYNITHVDHTIQLTGNGYVLVNDTIELSGQAPNSFLLGFPHNYDKVILRGAAYDASDRSNTFPVALNVPLEDRVGFYGARVDFSQGAPQVFSVEFVLSNDLMVQEGQNSSTYTLLFPGFPSLTKTAAVCNASIILPQGAQYVKGTVGGFTYAQENLTAFAYNISAVTFTTGDLKIQMFDLKQLNREVSINGFGQIEGSDSYYLTNKASQLMDRVEIFLPANATNPSAEDQFGRTMDQPTLVDANTSRYNLNFKLPVESGNSTRFVVNYNLPSDVYTKSQGGNSFAFNMSLFQKVDYYITEASVSFILPEGAKIQSFEDTAIGDSYSIGRSVFQETVAVTKQSIISSDSFDIAITYGYNTLWVAFRPTIWIWTLAIVGSLIIAVWKRPKAPVRVGAPSTTLKVRPEDLKSLVDSYEEKLKINVELASLEAKVQKGRIPRRRYKVQKKTLEMRLSALSRSLSELREKMRGAGGHYADLMLQLEVAESEMNEVAVNIKNTEVLHNSGGLSLEAYRKRLADYEHRKEKVETTINGILLRLREEIR